ncbi:MAG TPA: hypothetical protein VJQ08_05620 [Candidatus Dormibacteraeota bacterium]|nr:hypothetical protein [Candidatus Dormibacteraeota bacterium]
MDSYSLFEDAERAETGEGAEFKKLLADAIGSATAQTADAGASKEVVAPALPVGEQPDSD